MMVVCLVLFLGKITVRLFIHMSEDLIKKTGVYVSEEKMRMKVHAVMTFRFNRAINMHVKLWS